MSDPNKRTLILATSLIFLAGGVSGAVIALGSARQTTDKPRSVERVCDAFRNRLQSRLHLTPEQMRRIDPILKETSREFRAIHSRTKEEVDRAIDKSNAEIAKELTPEQRIQLEQMSAERREWAQRKLLGRRPGKDGAKQEGDSARDRKGQN